MILFRSLIFSLLVGFSLPTYAIVLDSTVNRYNLLKEVKIYVDVNRSATADEIIRHPEKFDFQSTAFQKSEINFGFSNAVYWVQIPISRTESASTQWVLEIPYLGLDKVDFYAPGKLVVVSGSTAPTQTRHFYYRFFSFPISLTNETQNYYLRVESSYAITIPLMLYTLAEFNYEQISDTLIQALYYGGLLSLLFYNLILFVTIKDKQYLIYSIFTGFTGLGVFAGNGYARLYLWPTLIKWDSVSQNTLLGLAGAFAMIFTSLFLNARQYQPKFRIVLNSLAIIYLVLSVCLFLTIFIDSISRTVIFELIFSITLIASIACLYGSTEAIKRGQISAYYFAVAWGALALGAFIASLRAFEVVPSNGFTLYALQIGSGIEMLLFSFALAYRIQSERVMREQAQSEALAVKQSALDMMKKSEDRLEKAVEERTEKLQHLLVSEHEIHQQYVRFGAMIAHEFRNPLNIIEGQTSMIQLEVESGIDNTDKRTAAIRSATQRLANLFDQWLESDRLNQPNSNLERLPINLVQMLDELMKSSRIFHPDHRFIFEPPKVQMVIDADNHLLQIAILNLIDNASKYSPFNSIIHLNLVENEKEIGISVSDQGCGIGKDDLVKIFDVYYRAATESKIKGTGLGLAFVKRIAELHGGRTEVSSQLQLGSTFIIWLPR